MIDRILYRLGYVSKWQHLWTVQLWVKKTAERAAECFCESCEFNNQQVFSCRNGYDKDCHRLRNFLDKFDSVTIKQILTSF